MKNPVMTLLVAAMTPQTIIVPTVLGDRNDLKPAAGFVVFRALRQADDMLETDAISVGRGIAPPM